MVRAGPAQENIVEENLEGCWGVLYVCCVACVGCWAVIGIGEKHQLMIYTRDNRTHIPELIVQAWMLGVVLLVVL